MKITTRAALIFLAALVCLSFWAFNAKASEETVNRWHLGWLAGVSLWGDTSNSDDIEADGDPGAAFIASLGYKLGDYISADIEAGYRWNDTHGINTGPDNGTNGVVGHGNNDPGHIITLCGNIWPGYSMGDWRIYAGGGVCGGYVRFLGEGGLTPGVQGGAGLTFPIVGALRGHLAYRALFLDCTKHDGNKACYDSHSVLFGLRVKL